MQLLDYQEPVYERMIELFRHHDRVAIVMPTGTGKFYIAAQLAIDERDKRVVFVAPNRDIYLHQIADFEAHYDDDLGNVEFITYPGACGAAEKGELPLADIIVFDEFHHLGAKKWGRGAEALCAANPDAKILGMSATPYRSSDAGRDMGAEFFNDIYAEWMTLADAWADPRIPLAPPKYVVAMYDFQTDIARMKSRIEKVSDDEAQKAFSSEFEKMRRHLESADGIDDILQRHLPDKSGHYIFFCSRIEHLDEMEALARGWFRKVNPNSHFYRVYNSLSGTEEILKDFKTDDSDAVKVLFAINMLNEGIHCDNDGIIMARPTESATVYIQQLGRALDVGNQSTSVVIDLVDNLSGRGLVNAYGESLVEYTRHIDGPNAKRGVDVSIFDVIDETCAPAELFAELDRMLDAYSAIDDGTASQWHPTRNGDLKPEDFTQGSSRKIWWVCEKGHEWEAPICDRQRYGCPYCSGRYAVPGITDLATTDPGIAAQWHPTRNGDLKPMDVKRGTERKVWWVCDKGHEWEASPNNRTNMRSGCPYCSGKKVVTGINDLATTDPELAAQWHPAKNDGLTPSDVGRGSSKKVWWMCEEGHEWEAVINNRANGRGCPYCSGKKVLAGFNDLATTSPEAARLWHPTKNGGLKPTGISKGSNKKVWWLCPDCGKEWKAVVSKIAQRGHLCE